MSLTVRYLEGEKFEISCRSHKIVIGADQELEPVELLNASLASCAAVYAREFLKRHIPSLSGLVVQCKWRYMESPRRVGEIELTIAPPSELTEAERKGLLRSVGHCTVKNTLEHAPRIRTSLR